MKLITMKPMRVVALALISGALLLALPLAAQRKSGQGESKTLEKYKRAKVHFLKGAEYLGKGKLEKVQKEIDASLEIFPDYSDARFLSAQLLYQQGQYENALKEIENAKSGFTTIKEFYYSSFQDYITGLREERDRKNDRIQELEQELLATPAAKQNNTTIAELKAALAVLDNRLREAVPKAIDAPAEYHFIHGNILFKLKRYDEARGLYESAILADPRHASAYNNLIGICFARGDQAGALKYLEQAEKNGVTVNEKLKQAVLSRQPPR